MARKLNMIIFQYLNVLIGPGIIFFNCIFLYRQAVRAIMINASHLKSNHDISQMSSNYEKIRGRLIQ
jgi:hypothetical protein